LKKFKFHYNLTRVTGTAHEDLCKFMIIFRSVLLRMRNISDKVVDKIRAHILGSIFFFESRAVVR